MELEHIFQDKDNWKKDTISLIKKDLLSIANNRFVQISQTHLVCLYGKSQVGKTTLILNMIGLKDECKKMVSEVLRGGVKRGNSSTSTAIIYSQNSADNNANKYGIKIETLEGHNITRDFEYFTPDEMILKLQSIRANVENNEFSNKAILHICIPKDYFLTSASKSRISILDLPGVESTNKNEKAHVESLMTRYIPISSVCIIACPSNTIQSLEHEELPNNIDWKKNSHKFLVVVTKSYSNGNIKSYFDTPRELRKIGFKEFVQDRYEKELEPILGIDNKTIVFPLDIGDSFETLLTNEVHNKEDRTEIRQTRDSLLHSLLDTIVKHRGEQLLSTIKELHAIVECNDEKKRLLIEETKNDLEKKKANKEADLKIIEKKYQEHNERYKGVEEQLKKLDKLNKCIEDLVHETSYCSTIILEDVKKVVNEYNLFKTKNGIEYFYDKEKKTLKTIITSLTAQLNNLTKIVKSLMEDQGFSADIYVNKIVTSIINKFRDNYGHKLYPPDTIAEKFKNLFGYGRKIRLRDAYSYIKSIDQYIRSEIKSSIIESCNSIIKKKQDENIKDKEYNKRKIIEDEDLIKEYKGELERIQLRIKENNEKLDNIRQQKKHDKDTLNKYLQYAEKAYFCQRNNIINKINSGITTSERILYILFLGVLENDYESLINASNE